MPGAVKGLSLGWAWVRSWPGPGQRKKYVGEGVNFPAELPRPRLGPCPLKSKRCCCVSREAQEGVLKPLLPLRRAQWSSRLPVESCSSLDETGTLNDSRLEMFQNPPGLPASRYREGRFRIFLFHIQTPNLTSHNVYSSRIEESLGGRQCRAWI